MLFNLEKGFLLTIKMLFINPGKVFKGYLKTTDRFRYYNPFKYAFILASASVFLFVYFDLYEKAISIAGLSMQVNDGEGFGFIEKYANFISLLIIPFISLGSLLLFKTYNYAEHLVANFYALGHTTLIGFVFIPFYILFPKMLLNQQLISTLTLLIYGSIFYKSAFDVGWVKAILKFFTSIIIGFLCVVVLSAVFAILVKGL